jgi:hypothetical protein
MHLRRRRHRDQSGRRGWPLAAPAPLTAVLLTAGCGVEAPTRTPVAEVTGGAIGPDASVSADVTVLQVHLEDGVYDVGEDADLRLGTSNAGTVADTLVAVTGPDFADVRSTGDRNGDRLAIDVPAGDDVHVGAEGEPALTLLDLGRSLRSSQSIPVTFVFERAGGVTVDAMVAAAGQHPEAGADLPDAAEDPAP